MLIVGNQRIQTCVGPLDVSALPALVHPDMKLYAVEFRMDGPPTLGMTTLKDAGVRYTGTVIGLTFETGEEIYLHPESRVWHKATREPVRVTDLHTGDNLLRMSRLVSMGKYASIRLHGIRGPRILEHRFVWEKWSGTTIGPHQTVYHIDKDTMNNAVTNLDVMLTTEYGKKVMRELDQPFRTRELNGTYKPKPRKPAKAKVRLPDNQVIPTRKGTMNRVTRIRKIEGQPVFAVDVEPLKNVIIEGLVVGG